MSRRPPRPDFDWDRLVEGMPIPFDEMQRVDDLVSRPVDESGGWAGDAVAQAGMGGILVPNGLTALWVQIKGSYDDGSGTILYEFGEVAWDDDVDNDLEEGGYGVALEVNDNAAVPVGTIVQVWPSEDDLAGAEGEMWRFSFAAGGTGGDVVDCSHTVRGVVNLLPQYLGAGTKQIDTLYAGSGSSCIGFGPSASAAIGDPLATSIAPDGTDAQVNVAARYTSPNHFLVMGAKPDVPSGTNPLVWAKIGSDMRFQIGAGAVTGTGSTLWPKFSIRLSGANYDGVSTTGSEHGGLNFLGGILISGTLTAGGITTEDAQDATAALFAAGTQSGITFTYNDASNTMSATVTGAPWSGITGHPTTLAGYGITDGATTSGTLAQFAPTTSAQLAGVITDETGTGALVFAVSPALTGTPTAPTATAGTSTTQLATTAFVGAAITALNLGTTYQPLDADLTSLAAASATGALYYRSGAGTWAPVTVSTGLSFTGGTLSATGGGGTGTVTSVSATAPAAGLTVSVATATTTPALTFALADDLAALEALTGTNTIYYRSAANTWSPVFMGNGLSFPGGGLLSVPTMFPAGASHAAGLPPDPGATAHTPVYFLADNVTWQYVPGHVLASTVVSAVEAITGNSTWQDLATPTQVTFTLSEAANILVMGFADYRNTTVALGAIGMTTAASGSETIIAQTFPPGANNTMSLGGLLKYSLAAGTYTMKMRFLSTAGSGTFEHRSFVVMRV